MDKQIIYELRQIYKSINDLWQSQDKAYRYANWGAAYFIPPFFIILIFNLSNSDSNIIVRIVCYYFEILLFYSAIFALFTYFYVNNNLKLIRICIKFIKVIYILAIIIFVIVWLPMLVLLILANSFKIVRAILKDYKKYCILFLMIIIAAFVTLCFLYINLALAEKIGSIVIVPLKHIVGEINITIKVIIFVMSLKIEFDIVIFVICKVLECVRTRKILTTKDRLKTEEVNKEMNKFKGNSKDEYNTKIDNIREESFFYKKQSWKIQLTLLVLFYIIVAISKRFDSVANELKDTITIITLIMLINDKYKEWR